MKCAGKKGRGRDLSPALPILPPAQLTNRYFPLNPKASCTGLYITPTVLTWKDASWDTEVLRGTLGFLCSSGSFFHSPQSSFLMDRHFAL